MRLGNKSNSKLGGRVKYNDIPKITHLALKRDQKKKKKDKWEQETGIFVY